MDFNKEEQKLAKAVDEFSIDMKFRLLEKLQEGYNGWDNIHLRKKIVQDLKDDVDFVYKKTMLLGGADKEYYIDIANRAMMLAGFCEEN